MAKIIIEVNGGCVSNVYSDDVDTNVELIDWDNIKGENAEEAERLTAEAEKTLAEAEKKMFVVF
jgi:hypothetical protein